MKLLKEEGYHSVTLEDVYAWKQGEKELTEKSIAITFDDGFYSTTKFALPVLKRYGFTGSVFVIGSAIDEHHGLYLLKYASMLLMRICRMNAYCSIIHIPTITIIRMGMAFESTS